MASCRRQRARAVPPIISTSVRRTGEPVFSPPPRHGELAAADLAASHRALGVPVLSIESARTYAPGINTGAVAVFVRFRAPSSRRARCRARRGAFPTPVGSYETVEIFTRGYINYVFACEIDLCRRLAHPCDSRTLRAGFPGSSLRRSIFEFCHTLTRRHAAASAAGCSIAIFPRRGPLVYQSHQVTYYYE